jgi:hypothetical protein
MALLSQEGSVIAFCYGARGGSLDEILRDAFLKLKGKQHNSPPGTGGVAKGRGGRTVEWFWRVVRSIYHPVAARHPSCSRRGVVFLLLKPVVCAIDASLYR